MSEFSESYLSQQVECSDPARLVEMLYQRAIRDLQSAAELWPEMNLSPKSIHMIVHAQSILRELNATLNHDAPAPANGLAFELSRLYEYMQFVLSDTVAQRASYATAPPQSYFTVIQLLEDNSGAWTQMSRSRP